MVQIVSSVLIISLMIRGCLGPRYGEIRWTDTLSRHLLDIYHGSEPFERGHLERMKQEWDRQLPDYANHDAYKLHRSAWDMIHGKLKKWHKRPEAEQEKMERILQTIFEETDNGESNHERRMLDKLLEIHPEYRKEFEMMRTVVHTWWRINVMNGGELNYHQIKWTPELRADLLYITGRIRSMKGDTIQKRIKSRWSQMHSNLNVRGNSLLSYAYRLENAGYQPSAVDMRKAREKYDSLFSEEGGETTDNEPKKKGKKSKWTEEQKADAIFIHAILKNNGRADGSKIKQIWDTMNKDMDHLSTKNILSRISRMKSDNYKPSIEHLKRAEKRFKTFAQIVLEKERRIQENRLLNFLKVQERSQQHQDIPSSSHTPHVNLDLTLGRSSWNPTMDKSGSSHTTSDHHPSADYHYGSSNPSQLDQVPLESQRDIRDQYRHQWNNSGSSNHTFINHIPFTSLPDTPRPRHNLWDHGTSNSSFPNHRRYQSVSSSQLYHPLEE